MTMHEDELGFVKLVHADKDKGFTITKQDNKAMAYLVRVLLDRIEKMETYQREHPDNFTPDDVDQLEYTIKLRDQIEYCRNAALKE